jgi:hypothetical protein
MFWICYLIYLPLLFVSVLVRLLLTAPAAAWVLSDRLGLLVADSSRTPFLAAVYMRNQLAEQLDVAETSLLTAARHQASQRYLLRMIQFIAVFASGS